MKVSEEKFFAVLEKYLFERVIPSFGDTWAQWMFGAGYAMRKGDISEMARKFGAVDENKLVDVDILNKAAECGFKASGGKASVSLFGKKLTFSKEDWDDFAGMLAK